MSEEKLTGPAGQACLTVYVAVLAWSLLNEVLDAMCNTCNCWSMDSQERSEKCEFAGEVLLLKNVGR